MPPGCPKGWPIPYPDVPRVPAGAVESDPPGDSSGAHAQMTPDHGHKHRPDTGGQLRCEHQPRYARDGRLLAFARPRKHQGSDGGRPEGWHRQTVCVDKLTEEEETAVHKNRGGSGTQDGASSTNEKKLTTAHRSNPQAERPRSDRCALAQLT